MTRFRHARLAGVALSTMVVGCGSTSTAASQSSGGATQAPSQTPAPLTAQIVLTGGINGTLALNATESDCQRLPSGLLSATFDGVLPGTEAGFTVLEPAGTTSLVSGDAVSLNTSNDFWHTDTSVKVVITMTANAASGTVTGDMGGQTGSGVDGTVADVHVSATFSCPLAG
jgi:hypothetical protein